MKLAPWIRARIDARPNDRLRPSVLTRALYALQRAGIDTVEALCQRTPAGLLDLDGIGPPTVLHLQQALAEDGLGLAVRRAVVREPLAAPVIQRRRQQRINQSAAVIIEQAVAREREACARLVETFGDGHANDDALHQACRAIAAKIRGRS